MILRARATIILVALACPVFAAAATESAQGWYARMQKALANDSYTGVIVYLGNGQPGSYRLVASSDGYARLTALLGSPREVIRGPKIAVRTRPNEPDMVVHGLAGDASLLPFPPASNADPSQLTNYQLNLAGWGRVAGENARVLVFTPRDQWRYGYRVWIAAKSGLPLRSELIGGDGEVLEQAFFTEIRLLTLESARRKIGDKALALLTKNENGPSRDLDGPCPGEHIGKLNIGHLPPGFRVMQIVCEPRTGQGSAVTHLLVGDGLATVSVFVAPYRSQDSVLVGMTSLGSVHAVGRVEGAFAVTAMGDAPSATILQIARSVAVGGS